MKGADCLRLASQKTLSPWLSVWPRQMAVMILVYDPWTGYILYKVTYKLYTRSLVSVIDDTSFLVSSHIRKNEVVFT